MKFFSLPHPYVDFMVFNSNSAENPFFKLYIQALSSFDDMHIRTYYHDDGSVSSILYTNNKCVDFDEKNFSLLSGIAISNGRFLSSSTEYKLSDYHGLDKDFGQFCSLSLSNSKISYKTDHFGSGHLYYYENEDQEFSIVSNRAHLLKNTLNQCNVSLSINSALIKGFLFSEYSFFTQQSFLSDELIKEIKLVRLGYVISQKSGKVILQEEKEFTSVFQDVEGNYENLLEEYSNSAVSNINYLFESQIFDQYILDLSGGKDSRLCLALLINADKFNRIKILTNQVANSDDLQISSGIVNLLGMEYLESWNSKLQPRSIEEGLNLWRSYFFGNYHRLGLAAWSPCGSNLQDIRISGAGGEIYRSFWSSSSFFRDSLKKHNNLEDMLGQVIASVAVSNRYKKSDLDELYYALKDEFLKLPGENLVEKVDNHYLYHRNRSHFGLRGFSFFNECLTLTPLLSIKLLKASKLINYNDRQGYKIFYDLYNKLAPFLLNIRFDKDKNPFSTLNLNVYSKSNSAKFYLDEDVSLWEKSQEKLALSKKNSLEGEARMRWSDLMPTLRLESQKAVEIITDTLGEGVLPSDIEERISQEEKSIRDMSNLYSILISVKDSL